jgi:hypothetical protein
MTESSQKDLNQDEYFVTSHPTYKFVKKQFDVLTEKVTELYSEIINKSRTLPNL